MPAADGKAPVAACSRVKIAPASFCRIRSAIVYWVAVAGPLKALPPRAPGAGNAHGAAAKLMFRLSRPASGRAERQSTPAAVAACPAARNSLWLGTGVPVRVAIDGNGSVFDGTQVRGSST